MDANKARQISSAAIEEKYKNTFSSIEEAAKKGLRKVELDGLLPSDVVDELRQRDFSVILKSYIKTTIISWN